ncbi:MAG: hypothetical protein HYY18_16400 [Planctomycetes bacterium]|nr:hypothetical protein [Planctomycetota bacterium]
MPSAVILKKDVRLDVPSVAPPLAEALGMTLNDVRLIVRKARGIFQENLPEDRAQLIATLLDKLGVEAAVVPQGDLAAPPRVRTIIGGKLEADALLAVTNRLRRPEPLPWKNFHFLSIGIIATPQYEEFLTSKAFKELPPIWQIDDVEAKTELRRKLASRALRKDAHEASAVKERARTKPKLDRKDLDALYRDQTHGYVDLWSFEPLARWRIARHEFNYESLGPRVKKTSVENFRTLVLELWGKLPRVLYTRIAKDYLHGAELHEIIFDNAEELERYERWFVYQAAGPRPRPGVLAPGVTEQLLGPEVIAPVDQVETLE